MPVPSEQRAKVSRRYRKNSRKRGLTEVRVWVPEGQEGVIRDQAAKMRRDFEGAPTIK